MIVSISSASRTREPCSLFSARALSAAASAAGASACASAAGAASAAAGAFLLPVEASSR